MTINDEIKTVSQVIRCYSGMPATKPILCTLNDNTHAVVKYPNNPERNLVLVNEILSYRIANKIGLNVPKCGLCRLDGSYSASEQFANYLKQEDCEFSKKIMEFAFTLHI